MKGICEANSPITIMALTQLFPIIYKKPTRCKSGSVVFINNNKYVLHVSDTLCHHHQEHYKL